MFSRLVTTGGSCISGRVVRIILTMCRVNYDKKNWELIRQQLIKDHTAIHVINRAQILNDALNLAKSNHLDYETALDFSSEMVYISTTASPK